MALAVAPTPALAATGDLAQKPGQAGCIRSVNPDFGDPVPDPLCADSTGATVFPVDIVISPDGRNAYSAGAGESGGVAIFDRNPTTGVLTQKQSPAGCISETGSGGGFEAPGVLRCQNGRLLAFTTSVTISPDGRQVYASGFFGIAILDRDPTTGALTQKQGTAGCISQDGTDGEGTPNQCAIGRAVFVSYSLTVSPDGKTAYVAAGANPFFGSTDAVAIFDRDPVTGVLTQKQGTAGCVSETGADGCTQGRALADARSVTVSPDGKNVYVGSMDAVAVFDRDATTGALTQKEGEAGCVSETGAGGCADGRAVDRSTGEEQALVPRSVAVSPDGRNVYVASFSSDAIAVFDRNTTTGALSQKQGTAGCISETGAGGCADGRALDAASGVVVSPDGENVYATSFANPGAAGPGASGNGSAVVIFDRDRDSGALTQKPGTAGCTKESPSPTFPTSGCAPGRGLAGATSPTLSPDAKNVYVAGQFAERIAIFDRELPPDPDNDGVRGGADRCPNQAGPASNQGCPAAVPARPRPTPPGGGGPYTQPSAPFAGCPSLTANIIRGTIASESITGTSRADRIFAGTGNDVVDGVAGNDCIDLGPGTDRGQGGLGNDLILAGLGADRVSGSSGNDRLRGNGGNDRIDAGRGNDRAFGDGGNDLIRGSFGNDVLHGVSGTDRLFGSRGRDRINGGSGRDSISAGSSNDRVAGDQGNDRINGNSGNDSLKGNSGNDRIHGSSGRDRISAGSGNDRITARDNQRDRISCGSGRGDRVVADRNDRVSRDCERVTRR